MGVRKFVNVSIGEHKISYSKINGSGNDFTNNLYDHGLSTCGNYFFLILFYLVTILMF